MSDNKEWEKIKTEYKEIPVPEHGIAQIEEVIERAKYHRNRRKKWIAYGAVAAALLLILFLPRSFGGGLDLGFYKKAENATEMIVTKDTLSNGSIEERVEDAITMDSSIVEEVADAESETNTDFSTEVSNHCESALKQNKPEDNSNLGLIIEVESGDSVFEVYLSKEEVQAINKEISSQIENISEQSLFLGISTKQAYYINEDELLVVVWKEENLEFIIPQNIIMIKLQ